MGGGYPSVAGNHWGDSLRSFLVEPREDAETLVSVSVFDTVVGSVNELTSSAVSCLTAPICQQVPLPRPPGSVTHPRPPYLPLKPLPPRPPRPNPRPCPLRPPLSFSRSWNTYACPRGPRSAIS